MSKNKFCSQEEYHDSCRCQLEALFQAGVPAVLNAPSWSATKEAMLITYPWAAKCAAIDAGFQETIKHLKSLSD